MQIENGKVVGGLLIYLLKIPKSESRSSLNSQLLVIKSCFLLKYEGIWVRVKGHGRFNINGSSMGQQYAC